MCDSVDAAAAVGTRVLLREAVPDGGGTSVPRGALGRVVAASADGYRIALADGREVFAGRSALALRSARQSDLATPAADPNAGHGLVQNHTVYAAVVGSRAFGLETADSETDLRGVYAAPTSWFWSLRKPPTHVDGPEPEQFSWELERFCELALKANPNLLQLLWSPLPVTVTPLGEELLGLREAFLSQLVHQTYNGYVLSQFKRIEADLRRQGAPKWKHVMHLLRLLREGRDALLHGEIRLDAGADRDRLLAVRAGELPWSEVERWRLALHEEVDAALESTPLPGAPDVPRVDAWLRDVRARSAREALA
jgi:hypothetical protein